MSVLPETSYLLHAPGRAGWTDGHDSGCPLSFDGDRPYFNSLHSWDLHVPTGRWRVANDNNWIKNASFEADRKDIPSGDKPRQERLLGWETRVIRGSKVSLDRGSPVLNHANSTEDRMLVIGERSLNMSDSADFSRQVYQVIASSPYAKFEDGEYTMTAKVLNSDGFRKLEMYAKSGGKEFSTPIKGANSKWTTIKLEGIRVSGNKVEVGFLAEGKGGSFCRVDDVSFVKAAYRHLTPAENRPRSRT